jgi:hypothetical protein
MIHFSKRGRHKKIGLNLYRSTGGFIAVWLWYDAVTRIMTYRRFRLRLHINPWVMLSSGRFNVIEDYLMEYDLDLVPREVLQDLKAIEEADKRTNEPYAYIKPQ